MIVRQILKLMFKKRFRGRCSYSFLEIYFYHISPDRKTSQDGENYLCCMYVTVYCVITFFLSMYMWRSIYRPEIWTQLSTEHHLFSRTAGTNIFNIKFLHCHYTNLTGRREVCCLIWEIVLSRLWKQRHQYYFFNVFFAYGAMTFITLIQDMDLHFRISWKWLNWK